MPLHSHARSAEELRQSGLQAVQYLRTQRRTWFRFWREPRADVYDAVSGFIQVVNETDISSYTDEQFALATESLNLVIDRIESYLAGHVDSNDTSQCYFLGDAVQRLRYARNWVAQGYSPDPAKRPSEAELTVHMYADAQEAFKSFA